MVDVVNLAVVDVTTRLKSLAAITSTTAYLYDEDDLLDSKKVLQYPAVGVLYGGLRGLDDSSKTGAKAELFIDIAIGGEKMCLDNPLIDDKKPSVTALLADIRQVMSCDFTSVAYTSTHKWQFVAELPNDIEGLIAYAQRWKVVKAIR